MKLRLWVVSAKNVESKRHSGGFYVVGKFRNVKRKTCIVQMTGNNPIWNEEFEFDIGSNGHMKFTDPLIIILKQNRRFSKNIIIGWNEITSMTVVSFTDIVKYEMKLLDRNNQRSHVTLSLRLQAIETIHTILMDGPIVLQSEYSVIDKGGKNASMPCGSLVINVFYAEGLPKMDAGIFQDLRNICRSSKSKKSVDPYFVATYNKKSIQTTVIHRTNRPKWFQRLQLETNLPLKGGKIKLELIDRDYLSRDDIIATTFLELSHISCDGPKGFLPCFGPAFVNFYGCLREYRLLEISAANDMNTAKVAGCAFRGRVLLSIETKMASGSNLEPLKDFGPESLISYKSYNEKREYILRATFLNGTVMSVTGGEISFEVSIGTYGYANHDSDGIASSTRPEIAHQLESTPSCFMPWTEEKPIVVYCCEWEDVSYRLEADIVTCRVIQIVKTAIWELEQRVVISILLNKLHTSLTGLVDHFRCLSTELQESPKTLLDSHLTTSRLQVFEHVLERTASLVTNENGFGDLQQCLLNFLTTLEKVASDSQIGIPDIFIWMLVDKRREAYCRISPSDVWYSSGHMERMGQLCSRPNTYFLREPFMGASLEETRVKAIIHANLWFGFSEYASHCMWSEDSATYSAYMEIAMTSTKFFGLWTSIPDQFSPPRSKIQIPPEWIYDGDWYMKTMSRSEKRHSKILWRRKIIPKDKNTPHWMTLLLHADEDATLSPHFRTAFFLVFHESHVYQCNIYVHQARCLLANDLTGLSDPSANAVLLSHHGWTEHIKETLCPAWNTTISFSGIILYGKPHLLLRHPPVIWIEVFDHAEDGVRTELIGETLIIPSAHLTREKFSPSKLEWHPLLYRQQTAGEVLASADLILIENNSDHPMVPVTQYMAIPDEITPELESCIFEVLCWGLRAFEDLKCPILEIWCEDKLLVCDQVSPYPENNFQTKHFLVEMTLPKEDKYRPPVILKLKEVLPNGQHGTLGVHIIKSISSFAAVDSQVTNDTLSPPPSPNAESIEIISIGMNNADWWNKYYISKGSETKKLALERRGLSTLQYYDCELENVPILQHMLDLPLVYPLIKGRATSNGKSEMIGDALAVFYLHMGKQLSDSEPNFTRLQEFAKIPEGPTLIRVYIVRAVDLSWRDMRQSADPYVVLKIGNRQISLKEHCKKNTLNPIFGIMSEFHIQLPEDRNLLIQVMDRDVTSHDDLIGETMINLEQRFLSPFRASCGMSRTYISHGPFQWRDSKRPVQILQDLCVFLGLPRPQYVNEELSIGPEKFKIPNTDGDNENINDRLALLALHAIGVVPEHVETRRLFLPDKVGQVQGHLEMWLDLFPCNEQPGPPVNITVQQPEQMVLRCVIYNVFTVPLTERSTFGENMFDIYVKGWMTGMDDVQETDVHFRSMTGEGNFNWRFVLPFEYLVSHNITITKKKLHFWDLNDCEVFSPPTFNLNILDYDRFSMDDLLAVLELDLHNMPCPSRTQKNCLNPQNGTMNLFHKKRAAGFWKCTKFKGALCTGCVEMELELLTAAEAEKKPAGFGRNPPNENPILKPPRRPSSSFSWLKAPCRMLRYIACFKFRRYSIGISLLISALIILAILLKSFMEGTTRNFANMIAG